MSATKSLSELNLQKIVNDLFIILSDKEKIVITKRFALDNKPRQTLEKIGKNFLVTRERVRQIEASALKKLKRNLSNTKLSLINSAAHEILDEHGGVLVEKTLISKILTKIFHASPVDGSIVRLALTIDDKLSRIDPPKQFYTFWRKRTVSKDEIKAIADTAFKTLKKQGDIMQEKILIEKVSAFFRTKEIPPVRVVSVFEVDIRLKQIDDKWGLMEWRHVNPKSIRDKINIVLKKSKKPLHFVEIANRISGSEFDKKSITVQAVHNDLIRYDEFILVGRGLYALKEWGFEAGTVADVIAKILQDHGPLSKKEIVKKVLAQRDVKVGTISLNLQKSPAFIRVGRAVYEFNQERWEPEPAGRGRKKVGA